MSRKWQGFKEMSLLSTSWKDKGHRWRSIATDINRFMLTCTWINTTVFVEEMKPILVNGWKSCPNFNHKRASSLQGSNIWHPFWVNIMITLPIQFSEFSGWVSRSEYMAFRTGFPVRGRLTFWYNQDNDHESYNSLNT